MARYHSPVERHLLSNRYASANVSPSTLTQTPTCFRVYVAFGHGQSPRVCVGCMGEGSRDEEEDGTRTKSTKSGVTNNGIGEWLAPIIRNPKCDEVGCGEWKRYVDLSFA